MQYKPHTVNPQGLRRVNVGGTYSHVSSCTLGEPSVQSYIAITTHLVVDSNVKVDDVMCMPSGVKTWDLNVATLTTPTQWKQLINTSKFLMKQMYIYVNTYVCIYTYIYAYIFIYICILWVDNLINFTGVCCDTHVVIGCVWFWSAKSME